MSLASLPAKAQEETQAAAAPKPIEFPAQYTTLKHTQTERIDKVIDGLTVLLKNGLIVRLDSLFIPDMHLNDKSIYAQKALETLQALLPENTEVMLYQTRNKPEARINRMGHSLAHLVVKEDQNWIQAALIKEGLAVVHFTPYFEELSVPMYLLEDQALKQRKGVWGNDSPYNQKQVFNVKPDQFAVVRGQVKAVAAKSNKLYINFGDDWKTDFTVLISPTMRQWMAREGGNAMDLGGEVVQVRGWVQDYNGPLIALESPKHLRIMTKGREN